MRLASIAVSLAFLAAGNASAQMSQIDPSSLRADLFVGFDDELDDLVFHQFDLRHGEMTFAERFVGQQLRYQRGNDVLRGLPGSFGLYPGIGQSFQNLATYRDAAGNGRLLGLGPADDASTGLGNGAVSVMFDRPMSAFGFYVGGADKGFVTVNFYRHNGTLIDSVRLRNASGYFAFRSPGSDLGGVTFHHTTDGVYFDEFAADF